MDMECKLIWIIIFCIENIPTSCSKVFIVLYCEKNNNKKGTVMSTISHNFFTFIQSLKFKKGEIYCKLCLIRIRKSSYE